MGAGRRSPGDARLAVVARLVGRSDAVRASPHLELPVSPRGALALLETARARALLAGREYLSPDDLKRCLEPCWGHRVIVSAESELEGVAVESVLAAAAEAVEVPR